MRSIVTGANGFLGSWLVRRLVQEGHVVTALVRNGSDTSEIESAGAQIVYGDVTLPSSLQEAFKNQDYVFHAAGVVAYKKSDRPLMDKVNVQGTQNVVETCLSMKVQKLVHISSVVAIGSSFTKSILNENSDYTIEHLNLGYFETKRHAEKIVLDAVKDKNLWAVCVNPSTIYGFGDAKKGSRKNQLKVAKGKMPFYTEGGVNVVAVEDVVEGIIKALYRGKSGERYILSSENITIKSLFEQIAYYAGQSAPKFYLPTSAMHIIGKTSDICELVTGKGFGFSQVTAYTASMYHWFSNEKARKDLGFESKPSSSAIENSVKWMKENGYLK